MCEACTAICLVVWHTFHPGKKNRRIIKCKQIPRERRTYLACLISVRKRSFCFSFKPAKHPSLWEEGCQKQLNTQSGHIAITKKETASLKKILTRITESKTPQWRLPWWANFSRYINGLTRSFSLESSAQNLVLVWTHLLLGGNPLPLFFSFWWGFEGRARFWIFWILVDSSTNNRVSLRTWPFHLDVLLK